MKIYLEIEDQTPGLIYYGAICEDGEPVEVCHVGTIVQFCDAKQRRDPDYVQVEELDFHHFFEGDEDIPEAPFYAVPAMEIFARDSRGGFFGRAHTGDHYYYVDQDRNCFLLTDVEDLARWRDHLKPALDVQLYDTKEAAEKALGEPIHLLSEFYDREADEAETARLIEELKRKDAEIDG